jgi:hypothetical protein
MNKRECDAFLFPTQRAWHDAMPAALESSSAYAKTAIAFDEKRRSLRQIAERRFSFSQPKSDELVFISISLNSVDRNNPADHAS